jgi:hypothetical protein
MLQPRAWLAHGTVQTSIDGNDDEPAVPVQGGLVFPQRNKHILFRGNLMHGVSGSLGAMHAKNVQGATLCLGLCQSVP